MSESVKSKEAVPEDKPDEPVETIPLEATEPQASKEEAGTKGAPAIQLLDPEPSVVAKEELKAAPKSGNVKTGGSGGVDGEEDGPPLPVRKADNRAPNAVATMRETGENPILVELREAFPNIEEQYVKAVIIASEGALDPAFNALLFLSDPESGKDVELPSRPIRRGDPPLPPKNTKQLEQDELLARQLNEQYNRGQGERPPRGGHRSGPRIRREDFADDAAYEARLRDRERRRHHQMSEREYREVYGDGDEDSWSHFVEKDIPEVAAAANRSLQNTATRVGSWFSGVTKSWMGEEEGGNYGRNNAGAEQLAYDNQQIREQQEALKYYEARKQEQNLPQAPERRRFNSFGARAGEDTLESHGISLNTGELSDDEDIPPQLPSRERTHSHTGDDDDETNESKVVPETTYIDTPETSKGKKQWQPLASEATTTPTKVNATSAPGTTKGKTEAKTKTGIELDDQDDEFNINTEDEL
ncbi:ubiquitin-binding protein CUE5 KNAG_0B03050 [Huiozyma naganishii CBS 8797]|uniref:CUE domain-containing protein n=1 Tax=Huiozyma naganishii (strain ATCC MYA-139 / BCRC 22969 / CBS 8797 / KCTC 17520 / NBRC 10181 / NCYC 3082 / Yp74L-3) TaxID=1071383 RepID=J7RV25_HUIN7|nr:hypothetical protein KNAG_0B03050 [Kazachstania naganishii CBS 8797]CCK68747.1 hypothetical protein KNAG_0B03050 [Kazachstania naganishii CBS 8797]